MKTKHTPKTFGDYTVMPDSTIVSHHGWRGHANMVVSRHLDDDGYPCVRLTVNGKRKKWRVHRIMAELFLPPRPSLKHQICHIDGTKSNNAVSNLRWGTALENAADREKHGKTSRGKIHGKTISAAIKQSKMDARLIAAAPELLAAAIAFDEATDSTSEFTPKQIKAFGALMDAVIKATGGAE